MRAWWTRSDTVLGFKRSELQVTCVRGVYLFFCACLQKVAEKNTESFYKAFGHACTRF